MKNCCYDTYWYIQRSKLFYRKSTETLVVSTLFFLNFSRSKGFIQRIPRDISWCQFCCKTINCTQVKEERWGKLIESFKNTQLTNNKTTKHSTWYKIFTLVNLAPCLDLYHANGVHNYLISNLEKMDIRISRPYFICIFGAVRGSLWQ